MYIKEVVIDGFKSYAHRTVVEGFDPHFNAITGLNGSGKSNILDSICFVLGITNLSQVRAGNLSELVYKQGQAGVNKAVVTIIFNNEDPESSPVGYETCSEVTVTRQVLLGGKSKYFINGRNSPVAQVQNLFHSVQLNVNNPHFLIMQGRITKVLNMKPHEILGMVEEAAGTRMYENKRQAALKTIEKKEIKLCELNSVLAEEITPTLERLRGEKQSYLQWSKNSADIERIERFVVASQYHKASTSLENDSEGSASMEEQIKALQESKETLKVQIEEKEKEIEDRSSKLKGDFQLQLDQAKELSDSRSKNLVKATSMWQNAKETAKKAESDLKVAQQLLEETKTTVVNKEKSIVNEAQDFNRVQEEAQEAETLLAKLTETFKNMSAGINEEGGTLPEQISRAQSDSKTAEAKAKQAKMKITHLTKELKAVEKELSKTQKTSQKLTATRDKAKAKVDGLKQKIADLKFSPEDFEAMEQEQSDLSGVIGDLQSTVDALSTQLEGRLAFEYSDPVRGFDRSKVKGVMAKLMEVPDQKHTTALEVVAGGKIFQVVVDEAITGKALLDRGKLRKRVTLIPLDKVRSKQLSHSAVEKAAKIAHSHGGEAAPAIELIGFDEEVRTAMEYAFGNSIVVDGSKAANEICEATKTKTVTLSGDVYDPSGTISGGSKNNLGTTLAKLAELKNASTEVQTKTKRLREVEKTLKALSSTSQQYEKFSQALAIAEAEFDSVAKSLSQTSLGMLLEKQESMSAGVTEAEKDYQQMEQEKVDKWNLHEKLKSQEKELTQQRELKFAEIEKNLKDAKYQVSVTARRAREVETQAETQTLEFESLKAEVEAAEEAVKVAEKAANAANSKEADLQMEVGQARSSFEEASDALDSVKKQMSGFSSELVTLGKERTDLLKQSSESELEIKKLAVAISRMEKERANAEKLVSSMEGKYPWIVSEKSAFGVEGGDYDFQAQDPEAASRELKRLKDETEDLSRRVNKKVMGMIEKAEGEYVELLRKRQVVENDKQKIQKVIEELDVKKKTEIEKTWVKVNRDFGSIFSTLLPGTSAKLEPPEGMNAWDGLEVKVAFGEVWKESLTELSGGQRSLLALSLILSLLLFKPAPVYILDEVDAALDLSHTQNIGSMLKTHFSQSQFIVVSLKEGMFSNANVVFRTKFVDGVSTVNRTIGTGSSVSQALVESIQAKSKADAAPAGKRQRRARSGVGKENDAV